MTISSVLQFMNKFETCVIATVNANGQPEAATVGFSVDIEFKILIGTNQKTRKALNLAKNNKVAMVVGFEGLKTLQIEGIAEKIDVEKNLGRINLHFDKVPGAKKFAGEFGQNYYLITPNWLRFTDYTRVNPVFETEDLS